LNGFTGTVTFQPVGVAFVFSDAALGNVPQFNPVVLDFGFITGQNFTGGSPNDGLAPGTAPSGQATFVVSGSAFAGFTEASIAQSLYVRFQRVGSDGAGSDVGTPGTLSTIPEPGTLTLLGIGGLAAAWRKRRQTMRSRLD
jgi:hypothetical protein